MKTMGIFEIKTRLSQVCEEVAATGECVLVTKRGKPFVRIDPLTPAHSSHSAVWETRERYLAGQEIEEELPNVERRVDPIYNPFGDVTE